MIGLAGVEIPEGYIDLGAHSPDANGMCTLFGEDTDTETYEEYTAWWYAHEYEGDRNHHPMDEVTWRYIRVSCLANDPAQVEAEIAHEREIEESIAAHDRQLDAAEGIVAPEPEESPKLILPISYLRDGVVRDIQLAEEDVPLISGSWLTEAGAVYLVSLYQAEEFDAASEADFIRRHGPNIL